MYVLSKDVPQPGVKAPLAEVDQVVPGLGHHARLLGEGREVVTAGAALAAVPIVAAPVLSSPDVSVKRSCSDETGVTCLTSSSSSHLGTSTRSHPRSC